MTATSTLNGKPQRKQLADQLDRLDAILDALAEGLPGAVAEACRDGARLAVKDAIIEIVTNPELRALLAPVRADREPILATPAPAAEPKTPSFWSRLKAQIAALRAALKGAVVKAKAALVSRYTTARRVVTAVGTVAGEGLPWRRFLLRAACVGVVAGVVCLTAPQTVAAIVSACSVATAAVAVQTITWLRRAARRFGLVR
jgi:hypothetical protein